MRAVAGLFVLALVAGCAAQQAPRKPAPGPAVNLSGYPAEFREGYKDGCASAGAARVRNESRFKADAQYASGWRDGFDICSRRR